MNKIVVSISKNNPARRKRLRDQRDDKVSGDRLAQTAPKVVTSVRGGDLRHGKDLFTRNVKLGTEVGEDDQNSDDSDVDSSPDIDQMPDVEDIIEEKGTTVPKVKTTTVELSTAADVIFYPATQMTRYSGRTAIRNNIERRMPGYTCRVFDVDGEGQADFAIAADIDVGGVNASVEARCRAATMDMALRTITIWVEGRKFTIPPVDKARSPEDTSAFLSRLATNVVALSKKTPPPTPAI